MNCLILAFDRRGLFPQDSGTAVEVIRQGLEKEGDSRCQLGHLGVEHRCHGVEGSDYGAHC